MKPPVPDREDKLGVRNGQSTGKVHSVGPPERMQTGELTGVALDWRC